MPIRESSIERHFTKGVARLGGEARKLTGRRNECDRLVLWQWPHIDFVELKAPGKKPRRGQLREHKRLRDRGYDVFVLPTKATVDEYLEQRGILCLSF